MVVTGRVSQWWLPWGTVVPAVVTVGTVVPAVVTVGFTVARPGTVGFTVARPGTVGLQWSLQWLQWGNSGPCSGYSGEYCQDYHPDPYHGAPPGIDRPCHTPYPGYPPPCTTTRYHHPAHHEDRCHAEHGQRMAENRKLTPTGCCRKPASAYKRRWLTCPG